MKPEDSATSPSPRRGWGLGTRLGIHGLNGWGIYNLNGRGIYGSNDGKVSYCFWEICSKITDLQVSTLSSHLSCSLNSSRSQAA